MSGGNFPSGEVPLRYPFGHVNPLFEINLPTKETFQQDGVANTGGESSLVTSNKLPSMVPLWRWDLKASLAQPGVVLHVAWHLQDWRVMNCWLSTGSMTWFQRRWWVETPRKRKKHLGMENRNMSSQPENSKGYKVIRMSLAGQVYSVFEPLSTSIVRLQPMLVSSHPNMMSHLGT